ncbi:MAG TPA: hypothetical protein VEB64_12680 [Azospirillaceae bacterium]|nr:hypothetical protein [Azospirillaceae bacterium]
MSLIDKLRAREAAASVATAPRKTAKPSMPARPHHEPDHVQVFTRALGEDGAAIDLGADDVVFHTMAVGEDGASAPLDTELPLPESPVCAKPAWAPDDVVFTMALGEDGSVGVDQGEGFVFSREPGTSDPAVCEMVFTMALGEDGPIVEQPGTGVDYGEGFVFSREPGTDGPTDCQMVFTAAIGEDGAVVGVDPEDGLVMTMAVGEDGASTEDPSQWPDYYTMWGGEDGVVQTEPLTLPLPGAITVLADGKHPIIRMCGTIPTNPADSLQVGPDGVILDTPTGTY